MPSERGELRPEIEDDTLDVLAWSGFDLDDWELDFLFESLRVVPGVAGWEAAAEKWAAFEVGAVVPRQNGKGAILEARQLVGLFVIAEELQIHTAHEFKTCNEHFLRVKRRVENSPELLGQVRIIRTGAGEQGIELKSGERLRFLARSRMSGRGFSCDTLYFDEAFELSMDTLGATMPTMSARPNAQMWYMSSAPHYGSSVLHTVLERAEEGDPEMFLRAWESPPDTRPDDVDAWRRSNPAMGIRIDEAFVEKERRTLCSTPEGISEFRRERLGIREGGDGKSGVVPFHQWTALEIELPKGATIKSVAYGLDVASDGAWSAVGSAGRLPNGRLYIDSVQYREGTGWVQEYVKELYERKGVPIRLDPSGSAGRFVRSLSDAGVELVEVGGREYQQACGELLTSVVDGKIHHIGQEQLDRSVGAAGRRHVGKEGGWMWARLGDLDISPLKAATLALSGVARGETFFMY